jgi:ribosome-associated toxin RatA of RatAB toxin-antitoxin module
MLACAGCGGSFSSDSQVGGAGPGDGLTCSGAHQHICAKSPVAAPAELLWAVLTDFASLAKIMPNLEQCEQLPSKNPETVLLFQKAFSQTVFWRVEASAVLEVRTEDTEGPRPGKVLHFNMISGDFAELCGRWVVQPDENDPSAASTLQYEIVFMPEQRAQIPSALAVFLLKQALPHNISVLASRAEQLAQVCAPKLRLLACLNH